MDSVATEKRSVCKFAVAAAESSRPPAMTMVSTSPLELLKAPAPNCECAVLRFVVTDEYSWRMTSYFSMVCNVDTVPGTDVESTPPKRYTYSPAATA